MPVDGTTRRVAIATPVYKPGLTPDEELSLGRALEVLARYDHYLVAPRGLDLSVYQALFQRYGKTLRVRWFDRRCFGSLQAYCRLLNTGSFYRAFRNYEFLLIYQLDCYVFRDELLDWCRRGYDYIGAPWFRRYDHAAPTDEMIGMGNGGLSLRRVPAARRALRRYHLARAWYATVGRLYRPFRAADWNQHREAQEDRFWCEALGPRVPYFRLPTPEQAIPFSFEVNPRRLYELNGQRLPFGCHAWRRYDPEFWQPFILTENPHA